MELLARRFDGAIVAVSHDRYLLDEIVDQIASLDRGRIRLWPGNYSAYTLERELELQRQQQAFVDPAEGDRAARGSDRALQALGLLGSRQAQHPPGEQQAAADRPDGHGRAAGPRAAQDRAPAPPDDARRAARVLDCGRSASPSARTRCSPASTSRSCTASGSASSAERRGQVRPPEDARRRDPPTSGEVWVGPSISIGYLAQEQDTLDPASTPLATVRARCACLRGRGRRAADEVPVPVRAGAPREPAPVAAASGRACSCSC